MKRIQQLLGRLKPLATVLTAAPLIAHAWTDKPVRVIVPAPAGGTMDVAARILSEAVSAEIGQPVIVDNKPGATGNIALRAVADAKPDGYTLLFTANSNMAGSRYLFKGLSLDTLKDFVPIAYFAQIAFVVVVSPKSPIKAS